MTIEMFASATLLRGHPQRGTGKVMYTLRTKKNGENYEKPPLADFFWHGQPSWCGGASVRRLERLPSNREIVIYTKTKLHPELLLSVGGGNGGWRVVGRDRGKEIKDAGLWKKILEEVRQVGTASPPVEGRHEYSPFSYNMPKRNMKSNIFMEKQTYGIVRKRRAYFHLEGDFADKKDEATFYYSYDKKTWKRIGEPCKMVFDYTKFFMGSKFAIFNYATKDLGGYVDIDYFEYGN